MFLSQRLLSFVDRSLCFSTRLQLRNRDVAEISPQFGVGRMNFGSIGRTKQQAQFAIHGMPGFLSECSSTIALSLRAPAKSIRMDKSAPIPIVTRSHLRDLLLVIAQASGVFTFVSGNLRANEGRCDVLLLARERAYV